MSVDIKDKEIHDEYNMINYILSLTTDKNIDILNTCERLIYTVRNSIPVENSRIVKYSSCSYIHNRLNMYLIYFITIVIRNKLEIQRRLLDFYTYEYPAEPENTSSISFHNNSCFIDCVVTCLFLNPNIFLETFILSNKSQESLNNIGILSKKLRSVNRLSNTLLNITRGIRGMDGPVDLTIRYEMTNRIEEVNSETQRRYRISSNGQGDPTDIVAFIFNTFIPSFVFTKTTKKNKYSKNIEYIFDNNSCIIECLEQTDLNNILNVYTDDGNFLIKKEILNYVPFLVFIVEIQGDIIYPKIIKTNRNTLSLQSVIIFTGNDNKGHYTAYIKYNKNWYYYNDIGSVKYEKVTNKTRMNSIIKNQGRLFFYSS